MQHEILNEEIARAGFQVKLWGGCLIVLSLANAVLGFVFGLWSSAVSGCVGVAVGAIGVGAAWTPVKAETVGTRLSARLALARMYCWSLVLLILCAVIMASVNVMGLSDLDCEGDDEDGTTCSRISKHFAIAMVIIVGVLIPIACFGSCAWCARAYVQELQFIPKFEQVGGTRNMGYAQAQPQPLGGSQFNPVSPSFQPGWQ